MSSYTPYPGGGSGSTGGGSGGGGGDGSDDGTSDQSGEDPPDENEYEGDNDVVDVSLSDLGIGWLDDVTEEAQNILTNPQNAILTIVFGYIVDSVYGIGETLVNAILGAYWAVADSVNIAGGSVEQGVTIAASTVTGTLISLHRSWVGSVTSTDLGIAAPAATYLAYGVEIVVIMALLDALLRIGFLGVLGNIPIVGSVAGAIGQTALVTRRLVGKLF